jgi:hypothetical protein
MFTYLTMKSIELAIWITKVPRELHWQQPELGGATTLVDVHVRRLVSLILKK